MDIDLKEVDSYLDAAGKVESTLKKYKELFDYDKLCEFQQVTGALIEQKKSAEVDSQKLSIGIVGAVKAGKSSFLNACIFDGEDYLPKAATPMTAALTRITYSKTPKAIIHFYTEEDWETIRNHSKLYDKALKKEYSEYCNSIKNAQASAYGGMPVPIKPMSQEEYEVNFKCKSENQRGAKELTRMISDPAVLEKRGSTDEIEGDIIQKLKEYVGATGRYTPIVSYVELQVDNPSVDGLEIVDTPGLNDPIVSRGIRTKQFLRSCDVVLLLSPCSQFMDSRTVTLMASSLPSAGVREILIVGSKFDSGILNENANDFAVAYKKSLASYKSQFRKNLKQAQNIGKHSEILDKMSEDKILFVSSTCFAIDRKSKNNIVLDENEKKVYDNLHERFKNFEDKYLASLSGINNVKSALNGVLSRKNEIIEKRSAELLANTKSSHCKILEKISKETKSSGKKLAIASVEELKRKSDNIGTVIESSRGKLKDIFEQASIRCDEKVQQISPQLTAEMGQHEKIAIKTSTHDEYTIEGVGVLGLKKEVVHFTVTDNTADTSRVINNIKSYSVNCCKFVNDEFRNIFNKEEVTQKVAEVVLKAFAQRKKEFDEDEILLPVKNVLDKISIPHISIDYTLYIDEIETRFKNGYAKNREISQLDALQSRLLNNIERDFSIQLREALQDISKTLQEQAEHLADQIKNELCGELKKLQGQVEEKEKYIKEYEEFEQELEEMKAMIS